MITGKDNKYNNMLSWLHDIKHIYQKISQRTVNTFKEGINRSRCSNFVILFSFTDVFTLLYYHLRRLYHFYILKISFLCYPFWIVPFLVITIFVIVLWFHFYTLPFSSFLVGVENATHSTDPGPISGKPLYAALIVPSCHGFPPNTGTGNGQPT